MTQFFFVSPCDGRRRGLLRGKEEPASCGNDYLVYVTRLGFHSQVLRSIHDNVRVMQRVMASKDRLVLFRPEAHERCMNGCLSLSEALNALLTVRFTRSFYAGSCWAINNMPFQCLEAAVHKEGGVPL